MVRPVAAVSELESEPGRVRCPRCDWTLDTSPETDEVLEAVAAHAATHSGPDSVDPSVRISTR
jgi:hypothetical protein